MANEILRKTKVEYSFQSSVYVPTGISDLSTGSPTVVDLTLDEGGTGLANDAGINSDQVDLGAIRPTKFSVIAALEWFAAVSEGEVVRFYWSASSNSNVAAGNPGNPDGVDGLYAPSGFSDDEGVAQMTYIGAHINNGEVDVQISRITSPWNPLFIEERYGQLVVMNDSGTLLCGTDDIESSVLFVGYIDEVQ